MNNKNIKYQAKQKKTVEQEQDYKKSNQTEQTEPDEEKYNYKKPIRKEQAEPDPDSDPEPTDPSISDDEEDNKPLKSESTTEEYPKHCPNCGSPTSGGRYCFNCGAQLRSG